MSMARHAHTLRPWVIFPLLMPYAIAGGYMTVALIFFLSEAGVSTAAVAGFVTIAILPQNFKFLWAPLIDATLGPKRWYAIGIAVTVVTLIALGAITPTSATLPLLTSLAVICGVATTLVSLPTEIITAYDIADEHKGAAAGWYQAANTGGGTVGGGFAILIAQQSMPQIVPAVVLAIVCVFCGLFVLLAGSRPPPSSKENGINGLRELALDLWSLLRSRPGALAILLVLLPIGTGGIWNLLPALAKDWHAGAHEVLIVSGLLGGGAQIVGSLAGGFLSDRVGKMLFYCASGLALSIAAVAMAFGPRTPEGFVLLSLIYAFTMGSCYGAFTAVVLEAIGKGAAATKFTLMICISNFGVQAVQMFDGIVHDSRGVDAMLIGEALLGVAGIVLFVAVIIVTRRAWLCR